MANRPAPSSLPMAFLYGDYACPYSYVADARLGLLASETGLTVTWRPLQSFGHDPNGDWMSLSEDPAQLDSCLEELGRAAAQLGLPFRLPDCPPSTRQALQAAEFARDCGQAEFDRFHRAIFRAVFSDGLDIGDSQALADVASSVGIDATGLGAALEDGRYGGTLAEVEAEAERYAITSTPTVLMGKWKMVGAAPMDVLRSTLSRAMHSSADT